MQLTDDTPVKLVSHESTPYEVTIRPDAPYGQLNIYRIGPNETVYWTWRVAKHFLGDPFLPTENDQLKDECDRAHNNFGRLYAPENYAPPRIEVYDMTGERIRMGIELTSGEEVAVGNITAVDFEARIAAMQAEIELLRANSLDTLPEVVTESTPDSPDTVTSLDDIPDDAPVNPAPRRLSGQPRTPAPAPSHLTDGLG